MVVIVSFPDEILLQIFYHLLPTDLLALAATCHRFKSIDDMPYWRHRCRNDFKYWDNRHNLPGLIQKPLPEVDWKRLYVERHRTNINTQVAFDSILSGQSGRLRKLENISPYGYDTRDVLKENIQTPDSASDVLARRWYAKAILGHIQRSKAIKVWADISKYRQVSLEEALLGFDQFILGDKALDYSENIADSVKSAFSNWETSTQREKALKTVAYLREKRLVGLRQDHRYLDVRNSLLSVALTHPEHPSLPLISTVIYCAVGRQLGLHVRPCGFPMHVYSIVTAEEGVDLDGKPFLTGNDSDARRMFLDPFNSDKPKPANELIEMLPRIGIHVQEASLYLKAADDLEVTSRCARNIINAVKELHTDSFTDDELEIERETALYASMWSLMILSARDCETNPHEVSTRRRNFLPHLINLFENHHPFDASLVREHLCPSFDVLSHQDLLRNHIRDMFSRDSTPKDPKQRDTTENRIVKYYIGQLFQHKRYHYIGVIYGWDSKCTMPEDWIQRMEVPSLERGRQQPFYHVLAHDSSTRYVAEDNIGVISIQEPPHKIMRKAGQYFKRWDPSIKTFVSNIRDEYPQN